MLGRYFLLVSGLVLASCGLDQRNSEEAAVSLSFAQWCAAKKLQGCNSTGTALDAKGWNGSLDIFQELAKSGGGLDFTRAQYEAPSVKNFIKNFGGAAIFGVLEKLPWDQVTYSGGIFSLINRSNKAFVINGLSVMGSGIKATVGSRMINLTGATLKYPDGKTEALNGISFASPGFMGLETASGSITKVPFSFIAANPGQGDSNLSPGQMIKGMSDIVNDPSVNWQKSISLVITNRQVIAIMGIIKSLAQNDILNIAADSLAPSVTAIKFGGVGAKPLTIVLNSPKACKVNMSNVPLLGTINTTLNIAGTSGVGSASLSAATTKVKLFGFKTDLGALEEMNFTGDKGSIKLGLVSIPVNLAASAPNPANAVKINSVTCR
jgi:hypothetical protein